MREYREASRTGRAAEAAAMQYTVTCHVCGWRWLEQDPDVRFIYAEHVWECAEEVPCFERAAKQRLADARADVTLNTERRG